MARPGQLKTSDCFLLVNRMKRLELIANLLIGGIGAGGQALLLAHSLDCYPFKILMSPPAEFYSSVGVILGFVSPLLSLFALYLFRATWRPYVTAIPVVACPLIFWSLFRLILAASGFHYASVGSDIVAAKSVEDGFAWLVLWLTFAGLIVGIVCGLGVWLLFKYLRRPSVA